MDFTKILTALSALEGKQTLNEAEKKETTWTDMKGNKHPATQVKGEKYTGKEAEKEEKAKKVKESVGYKPVDMAALIARMDSIVEGAKPDFLDADEDGDKKEPMKKALDDKEEVDEGKKPDFLDVDKDGDKKEPMKKALKDKEDVKEAEDRPDAKSKDRTWTDKSGKKHPAKEVQGWQSVKGDKEADKEKKATMKEGRVDECGMMGGDAMGMEQSDSGMNVNTSIDTRTGRKTVSISADGEAADQLMQMLKLAGVGGMGGEEGPGPDGSMEHEAGEGEVEVQLIPLAHAEGGFQHSSEEGEEHEEEVEETYSNEPNQQTQGVDAQMQQGTDLNKQKQMVKRSYKQGDNPMAMESAKFDFEAKLMEELESIKVKK